jgi:branched-chain amino acid transport system substrate-binding protein
MAMKATSARTLAWAAVTAAASLVAASAVGQQKEIVVGVQCDRTGAMQIIGVNLCPAYQDYINLINSRGGIEGYKVRADEIDCRTS